MSRMIRGGRLSRMETSGDRRSLPAARMPRGQIVKRLWTYLGRNRALLVLAMVLTFLSSSVALKA